MVARDSNAANVFETKLSSTMSATDTTAAVETTNGGPASPCYLIMDPTSNTKREVIYFDGAFTSTTFTTTAPANRGLAGSAGGAQEHPVGTKVRCVPLAQHLEDIHDRVDERPTLAESNAAYQPTQGSVFIGVGQFVASAGAPTTGTVQNIAVWLLDPAAVEELSSHVRIPEGWSTFDVRAWWTNPGTNTGDVVMRFDYDLYAAGSTLTRSLATAQTVAAPANRVIQASTLASGLSVGADSVIAANFVRIADAAGDTLAADMALLGIELVKVS
jgi:hypothetical protein